MKKTELKQTVFVELWSSGSGKKIEREVNQKISIEKESDGTSTAVISHYGDEIMMGLENLKKFHTMIGEAIVKHEKPVEHNFDDWPI